MTPSPTRARHRTGPPSRAGLAIVLLVTAACGSGATGRGAPAEASAARPPSAAATPAPPGTIDGAIAAGSAPTVATPSSSTPAKRTLRYPALGDSFTIGTGSSESEAFPAVFARTSGCDVTLKNVAKNGFTTDDVLARELPALAEFRPDFVTLGIGANDRVRGHPVAAYRKNVARILDAVLASGVRPDAIVLVPQPDWSRSPAARDFGAPEELARAIREMNAVLKEEGDRRGVRWLGIEALLAEQAARGELAPDRLHPSAAAHAAWARALVDAVCPR